MNSDSLASLRGGPSSFLQDFLGDSHIDWLMDIDWIDFGQTVKQSLGAGIEKKAPP